MPTSPQTLRCAGWFALAFGTVVLLLAIRYANLGLGLIAAGVGIIGILCLADALRHATAHARARVPRLRSAGRRRVSLPGRP